jgi:microbial collagenase
MSSTAPSRVLAAIALLTAALSTSLHAAEPAGPEVRLDQAFVLGAGQASSSKQARLEEQLFGDHIARHARPASERAPHQPRLQNQAATDYAHDHAKSSFLARPSALLGKAGASAECDLTRLTSSTGSALVSAVRSASVSCINETFALSGSQANAAFRESQMVTIADAFRSQAANYDGTNSGGILQLILYLRAGYYVQFYDPAVGAYGGALSNAVRAALDTFASSPRFGLVNNTHGEILAEYVTLIDSSEQNARYLDTVVRRLLDSYNASFDQHYWMLVAVNNTFNILFRGHQNDAFRALVQNNSSIVDVLYGFANRNWSLLGSEQDYLVANAARETARFLQYTGNLKSIASSRAKALADRSSITGTSAKVWIGIGEMVDFYDRANCASYGMCDFANRVQSAVLPINHTCSSQLRIRAQSMASSELAWACQQVAGIDTYFHERLATQRRPVADDLNTALEMVVFDSSSDYQTYAGAIYGIDTNNGGMYLEGNPATPGNQARFIAYEAEWRRPTFEIWNLHHEYVHYLDGRYNLYGDFSRSISQRTVWWIEGLAEYIAYGFRNLTYTAAVNEAARGTFPISTIYENDYNSGQTRVYNWGYLAVRFMFEQRRSQVSDIVGRLRVNDYAGYATLMGQLGSQNNPAFAAWLPCVANPSGSGCGGGGTDTTPPSKPSNLSTTVRSSSQIDLVWSASTDGGGSGLAGYRIERCQGATCSNFSEIGTTASPQFSSTGLAASTTYRYRVRAFDGAGNASGYSSVASGTTSAGATDTTPPSTPTGVSANVRGSAQIDLSWSASTDTGGSGLAGYRIERCQGASCTSFSEIGTTTSTQFSNTGLSAATTYRYRLRAVDGSGNVSGYSSVTSATTSSNGGGSTVLQNGVAVTGLAASTGGTLNYTLDVPAGASNLRFELSEGSGDADLYVRFGSAPTTSTYDCRPYLSGNSETCSVAAPQAGRYHVMVRADRSFSGVRLLARYETGGGSTLPLCSASDPRELGRNCRLQGLAASQGNTSYHYLRVPAGVSQLRIRSQGGAGNADLYVSYFGWAGPQQHHFRSTNNGNGELITINSPVEGVLYISLLAQTDFSGVELSTEY